MAKRLIVVGAAALLVLFLAGGVFWIIAREFYWRSVEVHFVVPSGFRGYFKIVEDPANGQAVVRTDGVYHSTVPEDGVLRLRSMAHLQVAWFVSASFSDGTILRAAKSAPALDGAVTLSNSTLYSSGDIWFWVGPGSELQRKYDLDEWPHEVGVGRVVEALR